VVTEAASLGTVNRVPRWRFVVRFEDLQGTTRWVVKRVRSWSGVREGDQVLVHFDPEHPGDKHRIFVA
jgi:hypothetical protein